MKNHANTYILFDIDDTLINSRKLQLLTKKAIQMIRPRTLIREFRAVIMFLTIPINRFSSLRWQTHSFLDPKHYKQALFDDVVPTLKSLKKSGVHIGVLSQSWRRKQLFKLWASGILPYFNPELLFISRDKKRMAKQFLSRVTPRQVVVVDNLPWMTEYFACLGMQSFLINRRKSENRSSRGYTPEAFWCWGKKKKTAIRPLQSLRDLRLIMSTNMN